MILLRAITDRGYNISRAPHFYNPVDGEVVFETPFFAELLAGVMYVDVFWAEETGCPIWQGWGWGIAFDEFGGADVFGVGFFGFGHFGEGVLR